MVIDRIPLHSIPWNNFMVFKISRGSHSFYPGQIHEISGNAVKSSMRNLSKKTFALQAGIYFLWSSAENCTIETSD